MHLKLSSVRPLVAGCASALTSPEAQQEQEGSSPTPALPGEEGPGPAEGTAEEGAEGRGTASEAFRNELAAQAETRAVARATAVRALDAQRQVATAALLAGGGAQEEEREAEGEEVPLDHRRFNVQRAAVLTRPSPLGGAQYRQLWGLAMQVGERQEAEAEECGEEGEGRKEGPPPAVAMAEEGGRGRSSAPTRATPLASLLAYQAPASRGSTIDSAMGWIVSGESQGEQQHDSAGTVVPQRAGHSQGALGTESSGGGTVGGDLDSAHNHNRGRAGVGGGGLGAALAVAANAAYAYGPGSPSTSSVNDSAHQVGAGEGLGEGGTGGSAGGMQGLRGRGSVGTARADRIGFSAVPFGWPAARPHG